MIAPLPARMPAFPALTLRNGAGRRTPRWALPTNFGVLERIRVRVRVRVRASLVSVHIRILSRVVNSISTIVVVVSFSFVVRRCGIAIVGFAIIAIATATDITTTTMGVGVVL